MTVHKYVKANLISTNIKEHLPCIQKHQTIQWFNSTQFRHKLSPRTQPNHHGPLQQLTHTSREVISPTLTTITKTVQLSQCLLQPYRACNADTAEPLSSSRPGCQSTHPSGAIKPNRITTSRVSAIHPTVSPHHRVQLGPFSIRHRLLKHLPTPLMPTAQLLSLLLRQLLLCLLFLFNRTQNKHTTAHPVSLPERLTTYCRTNTLSSVHENT